MVASAYAQGGGFVTPNEPSEIVYSHWFGDCSVSKTADVSCAMRLEAHSASGELMGFVVFGHEERSRFLAIEVRRSLADAPFVIRIDDVPISKRPISCRGTAKFCSVVLAVGDRLLHRLLAAAMLTGEVVGGTKLRFPLRDFARSRRTIL